MPLDDDNQVNSPAGSTQADDASEERSSSQDPPLDPDKVLEEIDRLPDTDRARVLTAAYSGPLPPPSILQGYETVLPGAAERILRLAEEEASHRRRQEEKLVESNCQDGRLGLWLGFSIGALALLISCAVAIWGAPWAGGFLGSLSIVALVSTFIYGSRRKRTPETPSAERGKGGITE
jgi:uncharacterized membrane protein